MPQSSYLRRSSRFPILAAGIASLLAAALPADAVTFIWDGGSPSTSNWNDAANWVGDVLPVDLNTSDLLYTGTAAQLISTNSVNDFNIRNVIFGSTAASYTIHTNTNVGTLLSLGTGGIIQNSGAPQLFSFGTGSAALRIDQGSPVITGSGTGLVTIGSAVGNGTVNSRTGTPFSLVFSNGPFDVLVNSNISQGSSGTFTIVKQNTGTVTLAASATNLGGFQVNGGRFVLDYATVATGNRLPDAQALSFGGGDLRLQGDSAAPSSETTGAVTVNAQGSKLTLLPGTGQSATFTGGSLARGANTGTLLIRGSNLGGTIGTFSQVLFTGATGLVGGAGAAATPQVSIIPFALGDTSATGTGAGLMTYDATVGARLLDEATEYAPYATAVANDNTEIVASGAIAGSVTINSLLLRNSGASPMTVTINDGTNLAPVSGTFLFAGSPSGPITLTKDQAGAGDATISLAANTSANVFVLAGTTATINAPILLNTTGGLAIDGGGTLVLNQPLANATATFAAGTMPVIGVNGGILKAGAANIVATPNAGGTNFITAMTVAEGATFDLNGFDQAFVTSGKLQTAFGSTITNTGANATLSPTGQANMNGGALSAGKSVFLDGTITDGTPLDGFATGLVSLDFRSSSSNNGNNLLAISHGGQTLNDLSVTTVGTDQTTVALTSISETDGNTIHGTITLGNGINATNSRSTLTANAVSNGTTISQTLGDAPIVFTSTIGTTTNTTGTLNIRVASNGLPLTSANTTTWTNDVALAGTKQNATITLDRGGLDALSANFTHQLGTLTLSGPSRNLTVSTGNGSVLEFTGGTTLSHTAATTATLTVTGGTIKLNGVSESGTGAKTLTKAGAGTLILDDAIAHTGATNVNVGSVLVTGSIGGSSAVTVAANATLGGSGIIAPAGLLDTNRLTVAADGIIAPGIGLGTLTVASANTVAASVASFASGAKFSFELNAGLQSDRVVLINAVAGDFSFGGNTINFTDLAAGGLAQGAYTLFTADAADAYAGLTLDGDGFITAGLVIGTGLESYSDTYLQAVGNDIVLNVVPEPATAASLFAGLGLLLGLQRSRRRQVEGRAELPRP